jgi:hypothetical protein
MWGANGQKKGGVDLLMVMVLFGFLVVVLPLPIVPVHAIFGYRKKLGAHKIRVCCYL